MSNEISQHDRFLGCLPGLACGDTVGASVESVPEGTFNR
jgi:ADP-ribosylglycohydrolase